MRVDEGGCRLTKTSFTKEMLEMVPSGSGGQRLLRNGCTALVGEGWKSRWLGCSGVCRIRGNSRLPSD